MRKTLIALAAVTPLLALGAAAFAASPAATGDDLFLKAGSQPTAAEKAEPLKAVVGKTIRLGDDMDSERGEQGEAGEGIDD